ncbi:putative pectate lyase 21 isoform X2 [Primulina tabacum]|uniref:putative pectate lyase 21 isoform X2 n=1 Tax=Primulina tabacum TaxID=48773 RepID=UPI003F59B35F
MGNRHGHFSNHGHRQNQNPTIPPQFGPTSQFENLAPKHSNPATGNSSMCLCLPYGHVDSSLRAIAGQAEGFGRFAVGGLHGAVHRVITLADDGPGSLRDACRKKEPLWIIFEVSGTIELSSYLNVSSYKTIDGRGQRIKLTGKGLRLKECEHVIICNLLFEGGRGHDIDGIQIKPNSKHIWIDRCSLKDYDDGLIDITRESTDITISRCIRVTIHHCFFDGTRQRHPRVRFGKVHLYNNYTRNWGIYAVCASVESQIYSQCNIYEAGQKKVAFKYYTEKAADKVQECTGCVKSEGDLFVPGTQPGLMPLPSETSVFHPSEFYETWTVEAPTADLKHFLQHSSGWRNTLRPADFASS